jgi:hypothetical protein
MGAVLHKCIFLLPAAPIIGQAFLLAGIIIMVVERKHTLPLLSVKRLHAIIPSLTTSHGHSVLWGHVSHRSHEYASQSRHSRATPAVLPDPGSCREYQRNPPSARHLQEEGPRQRFVRASKVNPYLHLSTNDSISSVVVRFKAVGNAPIMKQNFYKITTSNRFQAVIQFLRKELSWKAGDPLVSLLLSRSYCRASRVMER